MDLIYSSLVYLVYSLLPLLLAYLPQSCSAIEQPLRRYHRSHTIDSVHVSVKPLSINMYPGDSVTFRCRAKGGVKADNVPFITFYKQYGSDSVMPLSASTFGMDIEPVGVHHKSKFQKSVKLIHFEAEFYDLLDPGENIFFCKGSRLNGRSAATHFIVRKMVP